MADTIKLSGTYDSIEAYNILTDIEALEVTIQGYKTDAETAATNAGTSETNAGTSATNAGTSESNASTYAGNALASANAAAGSANDALGSANAASASATLASQWASKTGGEVADGEYSAKYYAQAAASSASDAAASEAVVNGALPLSGGTLTGEVEGITPATSDNSTKLATTAWGVNALKQYAFILDDSRTPTIPNNANLNDYTTAGTYRATSSSVSATLSNCPVSNYAIKLFVIETGYGSSNYCMQIIVAGARSLYFRTRTTSAWTVWGKISYTDV